MKNYVIAVLSLLLFIGVLRLDNLQQSNRSLADHITHQKDSVKLWKDELKRSHAEKNILQLDRDHFKELYAKEVAKDFKAKPKQIESITNISTTTKEDVSVKIDSTGIINHRQPWLDITGKLEGDSLHLNIQSRDSIRLITKHRKRFFSPDIYSIHALSYNPYTTFSEVDHVEIRPRRKRFSIGAGVYLTPYGVQVGVGLQYSIFQF